MSTIFSENLKELRRINNYSQKQAAELIGIGRARYGSYEEHRCEPPLDILVSICKCYGITDLYGLLTQKIENNLHFKKLKGDKYYENKAYIALVKINKILTDIKVFENSKN